MLPVLQLGPYQLSTYGAVAAFVLVVFGMYSTHRLFRLPYPPDFILKGLFLTILGGAISTFLVPFLINAFRAAQSGPTFEPEGRSVVWTLTGGTIVAALYCWRYKVSLGRALDLGALPIPLGLAIARLGCLAAGCCHGRPTDSWLGMRLPDEFGVWMVRYPTQLMSAAANLLTFVVVVAAERLGTRRRSDHEAGGTWPFDGFLTLLILILYSLKRFVMAFLRESGPPLIGPFTWMHLSGLMVWVAATALMARNLYRVAHSGRAVKEFS
jgi:phosphatidylglycerol:prolipoprotein diacylglycerol transferase